MTTDKVQVVHYDRLKRYHGPIPVASNVQTRPTTHTTGYQTPRVPYFDHSQCGQTFILFTFAPQMTSPHPVNRPTSPIPSPTPIADNLLNRSPSATPPPVLSSACRCNLLSPTRSIDQERRLMTHPDGRKSSSFSSQGATFVQFSLPHGLILSSIVLLTISASVSVVHHSRTVLQHSAPL